MEEKPKVVKQHVVITSDKEKKTALILCCLCFVGLGGIHDFYLGNIGKGIVKLITVNWFLIGGFLDLIKIASGAYRDSSGAPLRS